MTTMYSLIERANQSASAPTEPTLEQLWRWECELN
jgi:hypothetical protein